MPAVVNVHKRESLRVRWPTSHVQHVQDENKHSSDIARYDSDIESHAQMTRRVSREVTRNHRTHKDLTLKRTASLK